MAFSPTSLIEVMQKNKSKKVAVSKIIDSNPQVLPVLPKLIADNRTSGQQLDVNNLQVNRGILETIHKQIQTNRHNNKNIIKLFPDVELAIQILVSSILSPKKMTDIQLLYKLGKKLPMAPDIASKLLNTVQTYVTDIHEIEDKLPEIVREALFTSGSYCIATVPEASVDEIINSDVIASFSTESFMVKAEGVVDQLTGCRNIPAYVPDSPKLTGDSVSPNDFVKGLVGNDFLNVTDNVGLFRFSDMKEKVSGSLMKRAYRDNQAVAAESHEKMGYLDIFRKRNSTSTQSNVTMLKTRDDSARKSVGVPMVVRIPSESIIPVSIPGNESEHTAYLVIMDENGKPLNAETAFADSSGGGKSLSSLDPGVNQSPVQIAYKNLVSDNSAKVNVSDLFNMYKDILEVQLYKSMQGALKGRNISIANKNDIYYLMFTRALCNQKTNILFIPKELMTYFAFYYDEYGVGKSILDNLSILCSLRSILLFSKVMAYSKTAIDVTKVTIGLSPEDPDPEKTIQQVQDGVLKLRQNFFPLGINNPVDLVNWIQRAGIQFAYNNNPLIPDVTIDFENAKLDHSIPESELEDTLRKQTFQALGLPPETIDNAFSPEFATNVVNNNILLSKRVVVYQKPLCKSLSKLVGSFIYNDEDLRAKLRVVIDGNMGAIVATLNEEMKAKHLKDKAGFVEDLLDLLSEQVLIELPKPENTNMLNLAQEFDGYKAGLEVVIESVVGSELFSDDISGELSAHADTIKNVFKHHLLKEWCSTNNYYPEVMGISLTSKKDIDSLLAIITGNLSSTMKNSAMLLKITQKYKEAMDKDLADINGEGSVAGDSGGSASSDDGGGDGGGGDGEGEDGGDMDESLDF